MQDFTTANCKAVTVGTEGQLVDSRDGKTYWVARLKDNNCWMVQNLDYDDPASMRITSTTGTNGGPSTDWKNDNTVRQYWDPGMKILANAYLQDVSGDTHLLVGNYYSYASVTNGTAPSAGGTATGSICPNSKYSSTNGSSVSSDSWILPTSNNTNPGSFSQLLTAGSIGTSTGEWAKLMDAPYYFQPGGDVNSGKLNNAGEYGYYWSSTASTADRAYNLQFYSSGVSPSSNSYRYLGMSVRCLVLGS